MCEVGPFVTVWASDLSFERQLLDEAGDAGGGAISPTVVEAVSSAVRERLDPTGRGASGVVAVANPSAVLLVQDLPQPPRRELVRVGALPSVAPVIEHRQGTVPFVVVLVDRHGADLFWSDPSGSDRATVEMPDDMLIRKFKDSDSGSGYRQHDFQQKAEQNWELTAAEVATKLGEVVGEVRPRVITVAGDVRMVQLLRSHLPGDIAALVREVPGSRSEDGAGPLRDDAIRRWIRTAVAEDTVEALQVFERERGQHDRAADGVEATIEALCESRVDVLLVHDDPDDERLAWYVHDQPALTALDRATLEQMGYPDPLQGRLVDVAIRASLATSASIRVVPAAGPATDGIGAILRW
jgi:hypothetical protein